MSRTRFAVLATMFAMVAMVAMARKAEASKCHSIKAGTKLHADVTGTTVIGEATTDVIGWFGWSAMGDPTKRLRFVKHDGDTLIVELDAHVKLADLTPAPCPRPSWSREPDAMVDLTWPDGRDAGNARKTAIVAARKRAPKKHGRACFPVDLPGITATVCALVADRPKTTCVAVASGKPVFARPAVAAQLGVTTKKLVGVQHLRVDDFLIVGFSGADFEYASVYVKRADTKTARCPVDDDESSVGRLASIPPENALLPDGTDAGFRIRPSMFGSLGPGGGKPDHDKVEVDGRTLICFDHVPLDGLRYRVCVD